jgi:hypothetical protein
MKGTRLGLLIAVLAAPVPAAAQQPAADEAGRAEAQRHFEQGVTLMQQENWETALLEFQRSLELYPTRNALFNLGMCQKALFRYVEAMATFQQFLDRYRDQADQEQLRTVAAAMQELRGLIGELLVNVNVPGAEILVDGLSVGTAPLAEAVEVSAGQRRIEARLDGYAPAQRLLPVTAGERLAVDLTLTEIARVGALRVEANVPGAEVWVDGLLLGTVPYRADLAEGDHELEVRAPGYEPQAQTVAIATGDERIVTVTLGAPGGADPAWFWTTVGLAGAATAATAVLGTVVLIKDDEYASDANRTQEQQDEGRRLVVATDVCLGIAVAAAIAATVLAFTTDWGGGEEAAAAAGPAAAPAVGVAGDGVGLLLLGRF